MSQFFAEAEVLIRPNTTGFAAQLVEKVNAEVLAAQAAIKPIVVGATVVPASGAATGAAAGAARTASADTAALATANLALTGSATKTADAIRSEGSAVQSTSSALRAHERDVAKAARSHAQFARGTEATGLSLLGIRGATLAASSAFLAGAASITIAAKSIGAASDRVEQLNKSVEVFATSAPEVTKWSETTATAMGISQTAALSAASTYGQLFRTLGIGPDRAATLSESLVKLASDLASFNNVSVDRALTALTAGLVGQIRPLRTMGIFLTAARVNQEALAESGKKTSTALTQQEKILARYNLIQRDAFIASGDFERTQNRLANQSRILAAQLNNLAADIGSVLLPAITSIVEDVNLAIEAFKRLGSLKVKLPTIPEATPQSALGRLNDFLGGVPGKLAKTAGLNLVFPGLGTMINEFKDLNQLLHVLAGSQNEAGNAARNHQQDLAEEANALRGMPPVVDAAAAAFNRLKAAQHGADVLAQQQEQLQAGVLPGGRSAEEANLQKQIAAQQRIVDTAKVGSKAYRDALREIKRLRDELAGLQAQDAADAQAAARKIQDARTKADQALQNIITARTGQVDIAQALAQGTVGTLDDLKALRFERSVIHSLILNVVPLIKDKQLQAQVYQQLRLQEIQTNNAIQQLIDERRKARQAQRQAAIDAQQQHLETLISIAQTTPGTADDLRTLNAYKDFLEKRIAALKKIQKKTLEEKAQLDAYRLALAQTNQSIRDLSKESQKGSTFAQQAFAFLQTQQGFVSNLLGNLIPFGATSGLVGGQGGGAPTIPAQATVRQVAGGFEQPRGVNFTAGEAVRTRPASSGQANTQITLLRDIRDLLRRINRGTEHPEAKNQRAKGSSAMDFHIQGTYGM